MKHLILIAVIASTGFLDVLNAQVLYVDAFKGNDDMKGTQAEPLQSIERAVFLAESFKGTEPIRIKIGPGLYVLKHQVVIQAGKSQSDTIQYSLEATTMPDDADWLPAKMPVISSVSSSDNVGTQFVHSVGLLIAKNNVHLKGIKFIGNANPNIQYYYPVKRENELYKGLEVSQCYFIGERNSALVQGAIWAQGADIHVDHCIFYNCKNALLLFKSITGFSLTHSIIYGAYESAVWFGPFTSDFEFSNNIVTHCAFFWLRAADTVPRYTFKNSIVANNDNIMGHFVNNMDPIVARENKHVEIAIRKTGKILLSEVKTKGLPKDYLNLVPESDGNELNAGIFKNKK